MPMKTGLKKRRVIRRRGLRKPYGSRRPAARRSNDYASASESIPFTARNILVPNAVQFGSNQPPPASTSNAYTNTDLQLLDFPRAASIASNYQFFRMKYLELEFLPDADTFTPSGGSSKPYLYYIIDKGNNLDIGTSVDNLKTMGAKAIALDEKPIKIRWRPGVSLATQVNTSSGTTSAQMYKLSPWLNTNADVSSGSFDPSIVCHYGIKFGVENAGSSILYRATLTAHFDFKKPYVSAIIPT